MTKGISIMRYGLDDDAVEAMIDDRIVERCFGAPLLTRACGCGSREVMLEFRLRDCSESYVQGVFKCGNCYDMEAFTFTAGVTLGEVVGRWNTRGGVRV